MSKSKTRKKYTSEEKFTAVIDSITSGRHGEAAVRAGVTAGLLSKWKAELMKDGREIFANKKGNNQYTSQTELDKLQRIIGKQAVQIDFLERARDLLN